MAMVQARNYMYAVGNNSLQYIGMDELPPEILETILRRVPAMDLLLNCRLVSREWRALSSRICRDLHIAIRLKTNSFPIVRQLFTNLDNLPWSACALYMWSGRTAFKYNLGNSLESDEDLKNFIALFGTKLKRIHLGGEFGVSTLKKVCHGIPNIESIKLETCPGLEKTAIAELEQKVLDIRVQFRKLKSVTLEMDLGEIDLLQMFLTKFGAVLEQVDLKLSSNPETATTERYLDLATKYSTLLASIPSVHLYFSSCLFSVPFSTTTEFLSTCAKNGVRITRLSFDMFSDVDLIPTLEVTLRAFSGNLEALELNGKLDQDNAPSPFNLPSAFPVLKYLKLGGKYAYANTDYSLLSPLTQAQFPKLERLNILNGDGDGRFPQGLDSVIFGYVNELTMDAASFNPQLPTGALPLNQAFPNLTKLILRKTNASSLLQIFSSVTHLRHLCLTMRLERGENFNAILSGVSNPDQMYNKSREEITSYRTATPRPSLLSLKNLKSLSIEDGEADDEGEHHSYRQIGDSGVYLSLLQIQSLDSLTLTAVDVSEECLEALQKYHHYFQNTPATYLDETSSSEDDDSGDDMWETDED